MNYTASTALDLMRPQREVFKNYSFIWLFILHVWPGTYWNRIDLIPACL